MDPTECAFALGSEPERARTVAEDIANSDVRKRTGKVEHFGVASGETEQMTAGDPQRAVAIGKDGSKVGIGEIGKNDGACGSLVQTDQSGLRTDPDVVLGSRETAQDGVARQRRTRQLREMPVLIAEQAFADGADPERAVIVLQQRSHGAVNVFDAREDGSG